MTILEGLQSINDYPIKVAKIQTIATLRGLSVDAELTADVLNSKSYKLATADVYMYLSYAPNLSQGGVSITFSENQRSSFKSIANNMYLELGESTSDVTYGYKGSDL